MLKIPFLNKLDKNQPKHLTHQRSDKMRKNVDPERRAHDRYDSSQITVYIGLFWKSDDDELYTQILQITKFIAAVLEAR